MSRIVRPVIEIVTDNHYLEAGLLALLEEMADREDVCVKEGTSLKIMLINAGRLEAYRVAEAWPSLVRQVRLAERYAFVSFSDACFDDVPHLPMNGPLGTVRASLTRLIIIADDESADVPSDAIRPAKRHREAGDAFSAA